MATFVTFDQFKADLLAAVHNFTSHSFKVLLTNTAPTAGNALKADITEIAAGNGYTAGGGATTVSSATQTAGTAKVILTDVTWTAAGGSIGPFRYAVLWNDTPASPLDPLVGYVDYGSSRTLADTESFTVDFSATAGVFTIAG